LFLDSSNESAAHDEAERRREGGEVGGGGSTARAADGGSIQDDEHTRPPPPQLTPVSSNAALNDVSAVQLELHQEEDKVGTGDMNSASSLVKQGM